MRGRDRRRRVALTFANGEEEGAGGQVDESAHHHAQHWLNEVSYLVFAVKVALGEVAIEAVEGASRRAHAPPHHAGPVGRQVDQRATLKQARALLQVTPDQPADPAGRAGDPASPPRPDRRP
jgi:hypothetical protein